MLVKVSAEVPWERHKVRRLERLLGRLMRNIGLDRGLELSVLLVGDERIRELNLMYLGPDEATDVLAFPQMAENELAEVGRIKSAYPEPLGDIVICLPAARKQAEETGNTEKDEIDLLAVHGLLHLLGFDDETDEGADRMRAMETGLLGRSSFNKGEKE
ncbi:MAG: rRNA maturation RNase YbeY [Actinobacteria bacterium]|nr:rRNA maturation RNase YbeY [Actinomycetota bacterium]